jgi:predicted outer membrane lipoprotein
MRRLLATLCLFTGLTAVLGGTELVLVPDGSLTGLPLSLLRYSPFADFRVPGLLLAGVVGVINTLAGVLVMARKPAAGGEALVGGVAMATWIGVEIALLRSFHWLHGVYIVLAAATVVAALAYERRAGTLDVTVRRLARVTIHALIGWATCAAVMAAAIAGTNLETALFVHGIAAPFLFVWVSSSYFARPTAFSPLRAAAVMVGIVALLDLIVVACFVEHSLDMFRNIAGTWLPLLLVFRRSGRRASRRRCAAGASGRSLGSTARSGTRRRLRPRRRRDRRPRPA